MSDHNREPVPDLMAALMASLSVEDPIRIEPGEVRTEWAIRWGDGDIDGGYENEDQARADEANVSEPGVLIRRVIGPWVEVPPS